MKSQLIAIEGLDGSGKTTQIGLLIEYLKGIGVETRFVHFPRVSEGIFGELIAKFLRGEFGSVKDVHPQLVALLFAQDRKDFAATIEDWLGSGYVVLMDRYVLSNLAFQCAKVADPDAKVALRAWINELEYSYNRIPKPDFSFYLDVPFSFVQRALDKQREGSHRDYLQGMDDIHEKDTQLQRDVKKEYESLITLDGTIEKIVCSDAGGGMRPIADIHGDIVARIN